MKTATEPAAGVELRPIEVTINGAQLWAESSASVHSAECEECGDEVFFCPEPDPYTGMDLNAVFERLRKAGIDIDRPMGLHIDTVAGVVTARQEPWAG